MHSLLEKQIKQFLKEGKITTSDWKAFTEAVNDTYEKHDTDHEVLKRSLDLTSKELLELYINLKEAKGKAAVAAPTSAANIEKALSLFRSALVSLPDGIIVVDTKKKILIANQQFTEIWRIAAPDVIAWTERQSLKFVLDQLRDPEVLFGTIVYLNSHPEMSSHDILYLKDRRVIECYSLPQRINDRVAGRVWSFRDITERITLT